jgi:hypothetical protein
MRLVPESRTEKERKSVSFVEAELVSYCKWPMGRGEI